MFCPNCGNQLADNAKFCGRCGYSTAPASSAAPVYTAPADPGPKKKKKKKSGVNWTVFIILMLVGLLIIGGGVYVILAALGVIDSDLFDSSSSRSSSRDKDDDEDELETEYKLKGLKFEISDEIEWTEVDEGSSKMTFEAEGLTLTVQYYDGGMDSTETSGDADIEYGEKNDVDYSITTWDDDDIYVSACYTSGSSAWNMSVHFTDEEAADEYMDEAIDMVTGGRVTSQSPNNSVTEFPAEDSNEFDDAVAEETVPQEPTQQIGQVEEYADAKYYYFSSYSISLPGSFEGYWEDEVDYFWGEFYNSDFYIEISGGSMDGSPSSVVDSRSFAEYYMENTIVASQDAEMGSRNGIYYVIVPDEFWVVGLHTDGDVGCAVFAYYYDEADMEEAITYATSMEYLY